MAAPIEACSSLSGHQSWMQQKQSMQRSGLMQLKKIAISGVEYRQGGLWSMLPEICLTEIDVSVNKDDAMSEDNE